MNAISNTIRLAFVGDICLGLELKDRLSPADTANVFAGVTEKLAEADVRIGNLECCLFNEEADESTRRNPMSAPVIMASSIVEAQFDLLGLANNHILDCGETSLFAALKYCERSGIKTFGAGRNREEALRPALHEVSGHRIAFLGFGDTEWYYAGDKRPGIAPLDTELILNAIDEARKSADLVVVTLHADLEFGFYPATWRVRMARQIAERGADLVIQHHPHVLQGIERHGNSLIAYSLGNFVFHWFENEYMGAKRGIDETAILMVAADFSGPTVRLSYETTPIVIDRCGLPQMAAPDRAKGISQHIMTVSDSLTSESEVSKNWLARCREEFRYQWGGLYWTLRDRGLSAFFGRLIRIFRRKDHQRWIKGLLTFGRC